MTENAKKLRKIQMLVPTKVFRTQLTNPGWQVYCYLVARFRVGTSPSQWEIRKALQLGHASVKEALQRLQELGLVENGRPQKPAEGHFIPRRKGKGESNEHWADNYVYFWRRVFSGTKGSQITSTTAMLAGYLQNPKRRASFTVMGVADLFMVDRKTIQRNLAFLADCEVISVETTKTQCKITLLSGSTPVKPSNEYRPVHIPFAEPWSPQLFIDTFFEGKRPQLWEEYRATLGDYFDLYKNRVDVWEYHVLKYNESKEYAHKTGKKENFCKYMIGAMQYKLDKAKEVTRSRP